MSLEKEWADAFAIEHAVAVNSATSGLLAACMAAEIKPGDEVITTPYTMSATAAAPAVLGARIRFGDIEPDTYCLDPREVANCITSKTKAVIVTNLFGCPAHLHELRDICDNRGVLLIEDNAQAIFAKEYGKYTGTIGHMGVFSLNVHKHLQVGEGGLVVTASKELDSKLREAMNHGEMRGGIVGLNLRMTEVTAAMAREQLKKAPGIMRSRRELVAKLNMAINRIRPYGLLLPDERDDCIHSFYVWGAQLSRPVMSFTSPAPFRTGYMKPLYHLPAFASETLSSIAEYVESRMVLLEVCSIDPTDEEINELAKELCHAVARGQTAA